jgi:hypothetical protein
MMNDERYHYLLTEFVEGNLDENLELELKAEMQRRGENPEEVEDMRKFSSQIIDWKTPQPSEKVKDNFYSLLANEEQKHAAARSNLSFSGILSQVFSRAFIPGFAYALIFLLLGYVAGTQLSPVQQYKGQMETMATEIQQVRQVMMLTLLNNPAASERLKAVQTTHQLTSPNEKIITALLKTLNTDPNENVRLAAVDALLQFSDDQEIRKGIFESIPNQHSPLLQVTMSQAMLALEEKESVPYFKVLLDQGGLNETAEEMIEEAIQILS